MKFDCTPEQLQILLERDNAAILRDLRYTPGWEVYRQLAFSRLQQMQAKYLKDDLSPEQAWDQRMRLQAVMDFQMKLEDIVEKAIELVDPATREQLQYSFQQNLDMYGDATR